MAGKGDIEAGKAFVSLYVNDSALVKGLRSASKQLQSWGMGIAKIGGTMMAAGSAVLAPLGAMVAGFAEAGSAVADMAARTGMGAEAITSLGYAAGMTGASIKDVEKAVRKMQQSVFDAGAGSQAATKALTELGLSAEQLVSLSPEKQFSLIADAIAKIQDPAERTAVAIDVFGKSGTALLPMLANGSAGLAEFRLEAEKLGLVMSSADAAAADALGDAMDRLMGTVRGLTLQVGAALAPIIQDIAARLTSVTSSVVEFVRNNRQLVVTVAAVAAGITAAGAVITGLGGVVAAAGMALGGLATVISTVGAVAAAILSPIGLVVAAVVAAGAAFVSVSGMTSYLAFQLGTVWKAVKAIAVALISGDFTKAWEVAKLAMLTAGSAVLDMFGQLPEFIGYALGRTARAIVDVMGTAMNWMQRAWERMFVAILETAMAVGPEILKALVTGGTGSAAQVVATAAAEAFARARKGVSAIAAGWNKGDIPEFTPSARTRSLSEQLGILTQSPAAPAAVPQQPAAPGMAPSPAQPAATPAGPYTNTFEQAGANAWKQITDDMQRFQAQQLASQAYMDAAKREQLARERDAERQKIEPPVEPRLGGAVATFSATALQALGQGPGAMDRLVKVNEDQKRNQAKQIEIASSMDRQLGAMVSLVTLTP